jgi:DNA-binding transcriptional ArsR family regulator
VIVCEDSVSKILAILSHPLRREVLNFINEKGERSFTDLLDLLQVDTGKLSFHLRSLSAFTEQTPTGKYKLSKTGERALRVVREVESWAEGADVNKKAEQLPYASFKMKVTHFS